MTKDELAALPQDAMREHTRKTGSLGTTTQCDECASVIKPGERQFTRVDSCKPHWNICPACWAKHPKAWPRFATGSKHVIRFHGDGDHDWAWIFPGNARVEKANRALTMGDCGFIAATEAQARAYAEEHGIEWPDAWGPAQAEGDGWEYGAGVHGGNVYVYRWHGEDVQRLVVGQGGWDKTGQEHNRHYRGLCLGDNKLYNACTLAEAKANLEAHGGTWPEEPSGIPGELPEAEPTPEPDAQPVGWSCRECGRMLVPRPGKWYIRHRCHTHAEIDEWLLGEPMPSWVQPGPLPGPWQETHEWTGECQKTQYGDYYLDRQDNSTVWRAEERHAPSEGVLNMVGVTRHILRPKPAEAEEPVTFLRCKFWASPGGKQHVTTDEIVQRYGYKPGQVVADKTFIDGVLAPEPTQQPGAQCEGCEHMSVSGLVCVRHAPTVARIANPANDCEHYQDKEAAAKHVATTHGTAMDFDGTVDSVTLNLKNTQAPGLWKGLGGFWSGRTGWINLRKDTPMETRKRSLITRAAISAGKGLGFWALKTLLTGGAALLVYHNLGTCWAFVNDPGAVLQPAWDATTAVAARYWPTALGLSLCAFSIHMGRRRDAKAAKND